MGAQHFGQRGFGLEDETDRTGNNERLHTIFSRFYRCLRALSRFFPGLLIVPVS